MVEINLFPWRQALIAYERYTLKKFLCGAIALGLSVIGIVHIILATQNAALAQQLLQFKTANKLETDLENVASADQSAITQKIFLALQTFSTSALCLTEIRREKNQIFFVGLAPSGNYLTHYLLTSSLQRLFPDMTISALIPHGKLTEFHLHTLEFADEA